MEAILHSFDERTFGGRDRPASLGRMRAYRTLGIRFADDAPVPGREVLMVWQTLKTGLGKSLVVSGRASRKEFWTLAAFVFPIAALVLGVFAASITPKPEIMWAFAFFVVLSFPVWICAVRRLHDIGGNGRPVFLLFACSIGFPILLYALGAICGLPGNCTGNTAMVIYMALYFFGVAAMMMAGPLLALFILLRALVPSRPEDHRSDPAREAAN